MLVIKSRIKHLFLFLWLFIFAQCVPLYPFFLWHLPENLDNQENFLISLKKIHREDGGKFFLLPDVSFLKKIGEKAYFYISYDYRFLDDAYVFNSQSGSGNLVLGNYFHHLWKGVSVFLGASLPDTDDSLGLGTDTTDIFVWFLKVWKRKKMELRSGIGFGIWGRSDLNNLSYLLNKDNLILGERALTHGPSSSLGKVSDASGQEDVVTYQLDYKYLLSKKIFILTGIEGFSNGHFYKDINLWKGGIGIRKNKGDLWELIYFDTISKSESKENLRMLSLQFIHLF